MARRAAELFDRALRTAAALQRKPRRKRPKGGSEPVTVAPDRPNRGEGGAAAALELDDN